MPGPRRFELRSFGFWLALYNCMENHDSADTGSTVPSYGAVSEHSQQAASIQFDTRKTFELHHGSASSPDLEMKPSLPALELGSISLSRTRTLPLKSPKRTPSVLPTLQGITFEVENLERLRRWVLGLAIGNYCLLAQLYILFTYPLRSPS